MTLERGLAPEDMRGLRRIRGVLNLALEHSQQLLVHLVGPVRVLGVVACAEALLCKAELLRFVFTMPFWGLGF